MMRVILLVALGVVSSLGAAQAVENLGTNPVSYCSTAPTATDIPQWTSGWTQPAVQPPGFTTTTGWNYVGSVNGNSAVYLGNGWVLTAAHVGAANLTLGGSIYPMVANTAKTIGSADLLVFRVAPWPALPALPLHVTAPRRNIDQVAMLGWGHVNGDRTPTWGWNTVTNVNVSIPLTAAGSNTTYTTSDFLTLTQDNSGNNYQVVEGDSGGAAFIYNATSKMWELAGVNEAQVSNNGVAPFYSAMVQIDLYQAQILAITTPVADTPALPPWAVGLLAGTLVWAATPISTRVFSRSL